MATQGADKGQRKDEVGCSDNLPQWDIAASLCKHTYSMALL